MLKRAATATLSAWRFRLDNEAWSPITTPHSWNALDAVRPGPPRYRRGLGEYARELTTATDRRTFVRFGAASQKAVVTWNDREIGRHAGGYLPFTVELPPGEAGTLRVAVDNTPDADLIPSERSDFFLYGGLTRPVTRYTTGPLHIAHVQLDAQLHEGKGQAAQGLLTLALHVDGDLTAAPVRARITLRDPDKAEALTVEQLLTQPRTEVTLPPLTEPQRWSPATPARYRVEVAVEQGDVRVDAASAHVGWRSFDFPAGGPFFLNGERLLLRGTHRHEDWAGLGSAVPADFTREELISIKAAGFNFVRLGHYPQADHVLELCDELGLIVWDELPWCRGGVGGARFKEHARAMLRGMIAEHRHHPCVIFWGLGNELDWESDHPATTDDDVLAFLRELHELSHALDPTRLTALRRYARGADAVDVYSPSIWSGWYRGRYVDYALALADAQAAHPRMLHMEWGADSHVGRHNVGPHVPDYLPQERNHAEEDGLAYSAAGFVRASRDGDWSESYMLDLANWHLRVQRMQPRLAGAAQWAFKDFGTPLRPENPIPYVNQKGLVDRENRPKAVYYLFQAAQTTTPVCRIEAHTWPLRTGDPATAQRVRVITNCPSMELFVNGVSQGVQHDQGENWLRTWYALLQPGKNRLRAVGRMADGRMIEDRMTQTLVPPSEAPPAGWLTHVEEATWRDRTVKRLVAQLASADGTPLLAPEQTVNFALLDGAAALLADHGTPDGSQRVQTANGRAAILVRGIGPGGATVGLTCANLPSAEWTLDRTRI